ncbi:MAG TPA: NADH-quinone oxidoreductase subunit N, partial [Bacteroidales bacterium]|nr:NADH-quinone oxidoreductase subunit N [Bacteroidales bacterium]
IGLLVSAGFIISDWGNTSSSFGNMLITDNFTNAFNLVMIFSASLVFLLGYQYYRTSERSLEDVLGVTLFSLIGAIVMVTSGNLAMFFIGLEIMSIALYVLAGSNKTSRAGNEAAMKYFLMGSFASAFLLFGIALLYGASGSLYHKDIFDYAVNVNGALPVMYKAGVILLVIGLAFKIAVAPFHFWAPDVYEGSPTFITTFMVSVVKVAGFAAFFRLAQTVFPAATDVWVNTIAVLAAASIIVGNFTAVFQKDMKRMLAYSSISHTGYVLLAIVAFNEYSAKALLLYSVAYVLANVAAFAVLIVLRQNEGGSAYEALNGLGKRNKVLSVGITIAMLSLTGIPPLAGFIGKYTVFVSALKGEWLWLVLVAILGSVVSIYYYFRPFINVWFKNNEKNDGVVVLPSLAFVVVVSILLLIIIPVFANLFLGFNL